MSSSTPPTMTAITQDRYGSSDVLRVETIPVPAIGPADVLVRVVAAAVDPGVWHLMTGRPLLLRLMGFGFRRPKVRVRGRDVAGRVEAVGSAVTGFAPGDEVFGCADGSFAEFVAVPQEALAHKPAEVSFVDAAALPISGGTAMQALQAGGVRAGHRVLVIGAAGGVGSFAVQLAVGLGASVTGVCSGRKVELVRSLGAADVIDYTREDLAGSGRRWDVIIDTGGLRPVRDLLALLSPTGTVVIVGGDGGGSILGGIQRALSPRAMFTKQHVRGLVAKELASQHADLAARVAAGSLTPAIDQVMPFTEAAAAIDRLEAGDVTGKVVLRVAG
ncbi:MAG: NAD(P)-dependent alcohol dehydrogenase [Leifsonia sp.]